MKPSIAVTLGDPAGIGPEIVVNALADLPGVGKDFGVAVVGEEQCLRRALSLTGQKDDFERISLDSSVHNGFGKAFVDLKNLPGEVSYGVAQAVAGKAAGEFIVSAVDLCKRDVVDAVCTAPINKQSFAAGGFDWPGHTEFLAHLTSTSEYEMSFFAKDLCVVLLSRHFPIKEALEKVTQENVLRLLRFTNKSLRELLGKAPKIAVAGLNPHASDGGLFGDEEANEIEPAIEAAKAEDLDVSGPHSPDTVFLRGFNGEFDAVVALYHDQATIPVKCLSFGHAVNVTLGLPIIRTSVDHGTAFEIAGENIADCGSMRTAIELAFKLALLRKN